MWSNYLLGILLIVCVITDIKNRKIYNVVLFPFLMVAWIFHTITGGISGLSEALFGTIVGFAILLIPYLLGGMGAGDVKLLAVIGGIKGFEFVLATSIFMAIAGGVMAILILIFSKGLNRRFNRIAIFLHGLLNGLKLPIMEDSEPMKTTYPYGIAIAAGALYQVYRTGGFTI